jgi:hypothetical protein
MSKVVSNEPTPLDKLLKTYLETKNNLAQNETGELEIKFGTRGIKLITKNNFDNVIQQLLSNNFKLKEESKLYLSIKSDIRVEIEGLQNIQDYCRTNKLPSEYPQVGYNFMEKRLYVFEDDKKAQVNFDNFNFRIAYAIETALSPDSTIVKTLLKAWPTSKKLYRLINRFTMIHEDYPLQIDLSIVRQASKENTDIKETNLLNQNGKYEIEIEVLNDKINRTVTDVEIDKILKKVTKFILSGLQGTNYPISYVEQNTIQDQYLKMVKGSDYSDKEPTSSDFIGPSSITLQINNIAPINTNTNIVNIRNDYTVTDKADGDRKMLYVAATGKIYLITTLLSIEFTGAQTKNKDLFNSLLDGEHIKHNKTGQFINLYAAFDIYFINNKDIRSLKLVPLSTEDLPTNFRSPLLHNFIKTLEPVLVNTNNLAPIRIEKKRFYQTSKSQSIFVACNTINQQIDAGEYEYMTDGFIFTPSNFGVGMTAAGQRPRSYKTTWQYSLKWKPAEFNTIDFLITTKKLQTGAEFIGNKFEGGLNTASLDQIAQYKTIILRVGFDKRKHGYINPCQNIINDDFSSTTDIDNEDNYKPAQFFPSNPYDPDAGITNIELKLDNTNIKQMFTEENEVIEDNTIVEFRYDINRPKQWRWIPLRVRYDKTAEYRSGYKNYGNAYHVAQGNWHSIHNPITVEMITLGKNIPDELAEDDIYYNQKRGQNFTKSLRDFHNLFVKNNLITSVANEGDTLIDYAVGKGGDISKWISAKLSFVFGIDSSKDNIQNKLDGVCARYLNYKQKFDIIPDALFIYGNSSQNIKNLSAAYTDKGKEITNAIFGEGPNDEKILGKGVAKSYGKGVDGFNLSSIQFAVHYMFENAETLHNFLMNIAECTKLGGYFIGTSYNGKKIFELLQNKKQGESYTFFDYGEKNKLLEITKQYDSDEFMDNISCLGYSIDVFQESINKTFREYLVNYDYLTSILENYGFVPLTKDEAKAIDLTGSVGGFEQLYNLMQTQVKSKKLSQDSIGSAYKMTRPQKNISFLNNYFIFKKVRNVDIADIKIGLIQKTPQEQLDEVKESLIAQQEVKSVLSEEAVETKQTQPKSTKKKIKLKVKESEK